jgi:hypothetical protein
MHVLRRFDICDYAKGKEEAVDVIGGADAYA